MKKQTGFTLIEIAIVLIVIGTIAGVLLPTVFTGIKKDKIAIQKIELNDLKEQLVGYAMENKNLPATLAALGGEQQDVWNHGYEYLPSADLVGAGVDLCALTSTALTLTTRNGDTVSNVGFVVASSGQDKVSDGTYTGSPDLRNAGDDVSDYVSFFELFKRSCTLSDAGTSQPENPSDGQITFESNMAGFFDPIGYSQDDGSDTIVVSQDGKEIIMGGGSNGHGYQDGSGCIWYQGDSGQLCNDGVCTFGDGLRAYFEFKWNHKKGDGFTFAVISAETNDHTACGGVISTTYSLGELLGYAGPGAGPDYAGIQKPKMALEFDIYRNQESSFWCDPGSRNDYYYSGNNKHTDHHLAFIYWGRNEKYNCAKMGINSVTWDDNIHGRGKNAEGPKTTGGDYYYENNDVWLDQGGGSGGGSKSSIRIEIERSNTPESSGRYKYKLKAWYSSTVGSGDFIDMSKDYEATPTMIDEITFNEGNHNELDQIYFGWTEGTGAETQLVTVSGFRLSFRQ